MDTRLENTLAKIDNCNRQDPKQEATDDGLYPEALLYGHRMSSMLTQFKPDANAVLQIAARAQHIERWKFPRNTYPKNRAGYLQWRRELGKFHAIRAGEIMLANGYSTDDIAFVRKLLTKQQLKFDDDVQALEDVICLVFIQYYFANFAKTQPEDKLYSIVRKTWAKMSPSGHEAALSLPIDPALLNGLKTILSAS